MTATAIEQYGKYEVTHKTLTLRGLLDRSNPRALVVYPKQMENSNNTETFPLLAFAHGFVAGGWKLYAITKGLLDGLASFGFIVVAPLSCQFGCPGWGRWNTYDDEILKLLNYVDMSSTDPIFQFVDRSLGYGVVGHSAGTVAVANVLEQASTLNKVKAGVILHSVKEITNITVPTAIFTGTSDSCCGENAVRPMYDNLQSEHRAYANMIGAGHTEPNFRSDWTAFVNAWFQIYIKGDTGKYYNIIYGNGTDSLCSGEIPMTSNCEAL